MSTIQFSARTLLRVAQAFQAGAVTRKEVQAVTGIGRACVGVVCIHLVACGCIEETGRVACVFNGKTVERISYRFLRMPEGTAREERPDAPCLLAEHWRGVEVRA